MSKEEPWRLSRKQLLQAQAMGMDEEAIEALEESRREEYEEAHEAALERLGLTQDEYDSYFEDKYGFEHVCHCLEDQMAGNMVLTSVCELETKAKALEHIEKLNIIVDELREQITDLGEEPTV